MSSHLNKFNTLISQLVSVNINLDDEIKAILLVHSLLNSWEGVLMAMNTSISRRKKLKFDGIGAIIFNEDMKGSIKELYPMMHLFLVIEEDIKKGVEIIIEEDKNQKKINVKG